MPEENTVPSSAGNERGKDSKVTRETKKDGEKRAGERRYKRISGEAEKAKQKPKEPPKPDKKPADKPIALGMAEPAIEVIDALQDVSEGDKNPKKVIASKEAIEAFRRILTDYGGYSYKLVEKMTDAQIVVAGHRVIQDVKVKIPTRTSERASNASVEDIVVERKVRKVESEEEERLTVDKVERYLETEDELLETNDRTRELVYETELEFPGSKIKFPVSVYKRQDGSYVMNRLPTDRYDAAMVRQILKEVGIKDGKIELADWEAKTTDERVEYLKSEFNLDTLPDVLNYSPREWGYTSPDRDAQAPLGTQDNPRYLLTDEMEFRDLILEKWRGPDPNHFPTPAIQLLQARIQAIDDEINSRIQWNGSDDTAWVMSAYQEYIELVTEVRNDPQARAQLDTIFTPAQRQQLEQARMTANQHYSVIMQNGGDKTVSDIESQANQQLGQLTQNWTTIDQSISRIMETARSKNALPGREGLREWFAMHQIEMLKNAHEILKRTEVQTDPVKNIQAAFEAMNFFEKSRSTDTFGLAKNKLILMLQAVENSNDPRITADMKNTLRKRIDSFEKVNGLLIRLDDAEGFPAELHKIAVTFGNEDWLYFYDRFNAGEIRDRDGNYYLVDANNNLLNNLTLAGESENAFAYQYLVDRWRTNRVQEMMRRDLNPNNPFNYDEAWIIDRLSQEINISLAEALVQVPPNQAHIQQLQAALGNVNVLWSVSGQPDHDGNWESDNDLYQGIKMKALKAWYVEETWVGADEYENGKLRTEAWEEIITQRHLRRRLVNAGVRADRINDLLGELQDPNQEFDPINNPVIRQGSNYDLMSAVTRDGFYLAKFKHADTVDRFRIYTRDGQQVSTAWGENTPYGARAVTHFADWMLEEGQGDARSVRELIALVNEQMSGAGTNPAWEGSGQLLAQNGTGSRFFSIDGVVTGNLRQHINNLITQEMARTDNPKMDVEGYIWMNQIMEGVDPNDPNDINLGLVNMNWEESARSIKSYPIHDMEDDRQKVWNWYMKEFREWTLLPSPENFAVMMKGYYSMRPKRRHPGTEVFLELQHRLGQHLVEWYGYGQNLTSSQFGEMVELCERLNLINHERGQRLINRLEGREGTRFIRQSGQLGAEVGRQTVGSPGWWGGGAVDLIKSIFNYLVSGK